MPTERIILPLYAGFWIRALALAIDMVGVFVAFLVALLVGSLLAYPDGEPMREAARPQLVGAPEYIAGAVALVLVCLYFSLFESSTWQATPGKRVLKLKVTDELGRRISFGRAVGRWFAQYLSSLCFYIGFMMVAFTKRNQALHDKIAGTLVVKAR